MVLGVDLPVQPCEGVEALQTRISLQRRQTLDGCANETILERLEQIYFLLQQGSSDGESRCKGFDTDELTVAASHAREEVLHLEFPLVSAPARFDSSNASREVPVLRRVRVGDHLHRLDCFYGKVDGVLACHWVGDVTAVHRESALAGTRSFHIDLPVRPAHNA